MTTTDTNTLTHIDGSAGGVYPHSGAHSRAEYSILLFTKLDK